MGTALGGSGLSFLFLLTILCDASVSSADEILGLVRPMNSQVIFFSPCLECSFFRKQAAAQTESAADRTEHRA